MREAEPSDLEDFAGSRINRLPDLPVTWANNDSIGDRNDTVCVTRTPRGERLLDPRHTVCRTPCITDVCTDEVRDAVRDPELLLECESGVVLSRNPRGRWRYLSPNSTIETPDVIIVAANPPGLNVTERT